MKIINLFKDGFNKSCRSWKWILLAWFAEMIIISIPALIMRSDLNAVFRKSMITGLLNDRNFIDSLANRGTNLQMLAASFRSGFFLMLLVVLLLRVFLSGGLFSVVRSGDKRDSSSFFSGASANFWSYLVISIIMSLIIIAVASVVPGIPMAIVFSPGSSGSQFLIIVSVVFFLLLLPVFLLAADLARAWQAGNETRKPFRAIGRGFKLTFSRFFSSWFLMLILVIIQVIYSVVILRLTGDAKPISSGAIFLFFLLSQVFFIIRIFLRVLRYGAVTSIYEDMQVQI